MTSDQQEYNAAKYDHGIAFRAYVRTKADLAAARAETARLRILLREAIQNGVEEHMPTGWMEAAMAALEGSDDNESC